MNGSKRINSLRVSPIRKLMPYAKKCEDDGIKVIKMNIGQPDIKTPKVFFEAMCDFDYDVLEYMDSRGIEELINAFIDYYKNFDIEFEYEDIIITQGASEAITFIFMAVCDLEDEILVPEPFYANYGNFADIVAVNLIPIPTKAEENFSLPSVEEMQKKINQNKLK